jgi:glycolate oxidase FAD binding subunit
LIRTLLENFPLAPGEILPDEELPRYALGKLIPKIALKPATEASLSAILRQAAEYRIPLQFWGAGAGRARRLRPQAYELAIDLRNLNRIISHDPDNFTITLQAGVGLGELQAGLEKRGQFFPFNPPAGGAATLGGLAAEGESGPWQWGYGSLRDLILGMKLALAGGDIVSFGGKTMKNVAGYDVGKLLIGSRGTLGAIVELTLRLFSRPEKFTTLLLPADSLGAALQEAERGRAGSAAGVQLLSPAAAARVAGPLGLAFPAGCWLCAVDLLGDEEVVEAGLRKLATSAAVRLEDDLRRRCWQNIAEILQVSPAEGIILQAVLPPAAMKDWGELCLAGSVAGSSSCRGELVICPGTGRAWVALCGEREILWRLAADFALEAKRRGGGLALRAAPEDWPALSGEKCSGKYFSLRGGIKQVFDPENILSPGVFLGEGQ